MNYSKAYRLKEPLKFHGEHPVHGGLLQVFDRDTSYWNPENGPNREDKFIAVWFYGGEIYLYGSLPNYSGKFKTTKNKAEWIELIKTINIADISRGDLKDITEGES